MSTNKPEKAFDYNLPATPGPVEPATYQELLTVYNAIHALAASVERRHKRYIRFAEPMGLGTLANIFESTDVPYARMAKHGGPECHGIVSLAAGNQETGELILLGIVDFYTGLDAGQPLYAAATYGQLAGASPGTGAQRVGYSLSSTTFFFSPMFLP